jgi:tetratricopeptide (TPR) repeat protein
MLIDSYLQTQIQEGKVILFLGSGASLGAQDTDGNRPPSAPRLGEMLADRFLGGKYRDYPLDQIGEYAINESDLVTVQEYIRQIYEVFEPSAAHRLLCSFRWKGIATTNYDRLVEKAYELTTSRVQTPKPFIENGDRIESNLRSSDDVQLLKLHGCITRTTNPDCPLILTPDQYVSYRKGRSRLFERLIDWATEFPILFIGHSLRDSDLRALFLELTEITGSRPRYYAVSPGIDDIQRRSFEAKKVSAIVGTFDEFMSALDNGVPSAFRGVPIITSHPEFPIAQRFSRNASLSAACAQFLQTDAEYVQSATNSEIVVPADFYKGMSSGWSGIEQSLDVPRRLADSIITDCFLVEDSEHLDRMEIVLIKAHAGAGKSVLLRRIAWDASRDYNKLCLYMQPYGVISSAAIQELIQLTGERIYLFVDDASDRLREIQSLANNIGPEGRMLTVIVAERVNEWNSSCESIANLVTSVYELGYLHPAEIDALLGLLEKHRALGTLADQTHEERKAAFQERASRQLLVALHEATLGRPFEDIIEDEFLHILPIEAQQMYLTICVLNRLNVPVRAGIISRLHGIRFEDFQEKLFKPLEHIVQAKYNPVAQDYAYSARHPHIAQIVFERILKTQEPRFDNYVRCLNQLNIDYEGDRKAFRQMIRGRTLLDLFPNHELVTAIYDAADAKVGTSSHDRAHLLHQMAIYEMVRPNGSLHGAADLLNKAMQIAPNDTTVLHSLAELRLRSADEIARTQLEREKYLRDAMAIAQAIKSSDRNSAHGHHTLVKSWLRKLADLVRLEGDEAPQTAIEAAIKNIEQSLSEGFQRFPGDPYLHSAEAELASLLLDSDRVLSALQQAFGANPRSAYLALRLASYYQSQERFAEARTTLKTALDANPGERKLHYAYAELLLKVESSDANEITYHLQRSFTPGDRNYQAQLLYGRQLFINGNRTASKEIFNRLREAKIGAEYRDNLQLPLQETFRGSIARIEATFCFISRDGINDRIYAHRNNVDRDAWNRLTFGSRVTFRIAFALRGEGAFDVRLEGQ